ncbi:MAG: hypothetical protein IK115_07555 [Lachnospiraceae bacterium]|nr:hypothetical protein [Lachnospiraceae bacterium]
MRILFTVSLILVFLLLPGLGWLWYSGLLNGEVFAAVPYDEVQNAANTRRSRRLIVHDSSEAGLLLLPGGDRVRVRADVPGKTLTVILTREGSGETEGDEVTVSADPELLSSAELYQEGEDKIFSFRLSEMCVDETDAQPDATRIRLTPLKEWKKSGPVLVMRDGGAADSASSAAGIMERTAELLKEQRPELTVFCLGADTEEAADYSAYFDADIFLRLAVADDDCDRAPTFAACDTDYYIPGLDSVVLADLVEGSVLKSLGGPAGDIVRLSEEDALNDMKIPACALNFGWHRDEEGVSSREAADYEEKAAEGLAEGIIKALDKGER